MHFAIRRGRTALVGLLALGALQALGGEPERRAAATDAGAQGPVVTLRLDQAGRASPQ